MRNEQIYHLRQSEELTIELQEIYFTNVISSLFDQERPNQILFSLLEDGDFIGYGGLVHINWIDMNAEVSFIMKTELENDSFEYNWKNYLAIIEKVAFNDLKFHKIFTYAFDLRHYLYPVLEESGFHEEARLKEHCYVDGKYFDVVINSKINMLSLRKPLKEDMEMYFSWANDPDVRQQSYNSNIIDLESHKQWFESAINDEAYFMCVFQNTIGEDIGQVRIQKQNDKEALIGISIDSNHRGKGYAKDILILATDFFLKSNHGFLIHAYIKEGNLGSKLAFENAGFYFTDMIEHESFRSYHFIKK
jgi:RimJ/RimL family protein N-acetyltransferase